MFEVRKLDASSVHVQERSMQVVQKEKTMTVKELREILSNYAGHWTAVVRDVDEAWCAPDPQFATIDVDDQVVSGETARETNVREAVKL